MLGCVAGPAPAILNPGENAEQYLQRSNNNSCFVARSVDPYPEPPHVLCQFRSCHAKHGRSHEDPAKEIKSDNFKELQEVTREASISESYRSQEEASK